MEESRRAPVYTSQQPAGGPPVPSLPTHRETRVSVRRVSADSQPDEIMEMTQVRLDGPSSTHAAEGGTAAVLARKSSVESFDSGAWSVRRVSAGGMEDTVQVNGPSAGPAPVTVMTPLSPQEILRSPMPGGGQHLTNRNKKGLSLASSGSQNSHRPHPYSSAGLSSAQLMRADSGLPQSVTSARPQPEIRPPSQTSNAESTAPQISDPINHSPFASWVGFGGDQNDPPKSAPEKRAAWSMILEAASLKAGQQPRPPPDPVPDPKHPSLSRAEIPSTAPLLIRKRSHQDV